MNASGMKSIANQRATYRKYCMRDKKMLFRVGQWFSQDVVIIAGIVYRAEAQDTAETCGTNSSTTDIATSTE